MPGLGKIHFSVKYDNNKLDVKIIECQGLRDTDLIGKSDPYVRLYILPGKHAELKTKTVNNNLNPVFNMSFSFTLTPAQILSKTAILQVFDSDFGKDKQLGEARFSFNEINLEMLGEVKYWMELEDIVEVPPTVKNRTSIASTVVRRESSVSKRSSVLNSNTAYHHQQTDSSHGLVSHNKSNLRELNNRLDSIVAKNKTHEEVDTKLIINLLSKKVNDNVSSNVILSKMDHHLQPLRDEYNSLAMLNAEIEILKKEIGMLEVSTDEMEEKILVKTEKERALMTTLKDVEVKYFALQREKESIEITRQTFELQRNKAKSDLKPVLEKLRLMRLDYGKWEGELNIITEKFNLCGSERERLWSTYSSSLEREIECPSIYWDVINEYSVRMDEEVSKLKEMYISYNNEIKGLEGKEMARLSATLSNTEYGGSDFNGILGEMEVVKTKMLELEMDKLKIKQKIVELRFTIDQEEAFFMAQFQAKEGAMAFLMSEYDVMKKKFFSHMIRVEEAEVSRFSKVIGYEEETTMRKAIKFESGDRRVIMGLSLTPKVNSADGEVIGWNIEEHAESFTH